ncbi:MAG: hypothetical protein SPL89_07055, partial [Clostridia bacterium]|nr:hypothetical protein [Clostridia bacterium]
MFFYKAGLPDYPFKTNGGQFHQIYQNIFIDNNIGALMQNWSVGATGVANPEIPARWWSYITDLQDIYGQSVTGGYSKIAPLLYSDTWKTYYTKTEPTKYWAMVFDYLNPDLYNQAKAIYDQKNAAGLTAWMEKNIPAGNTNFLYDNVFVNVPVIMYEGGWAETKNNVSFSKKEGEELFVNYGTDFTLTDKGLDTIKKSIPGFEPADFGKIGNTGSLGGSAPTAGDVYIQGTPAVGKTLTTAYTYSDADNNTEGNTKIYWYRSNAKNGTYTRILTGYGRCYTVTAEDENKYLSCRVIPQDDTHIYEREYVSEAVFIDPNATVVDKDRLWKLIADVDRVLETAVVGTEAGQYPTEAKNALEIARNDAFAVANNQKAFQYQVNTAEENLNEALILFKNSENNPFDSLGVERISLAELIADPDGWTKALGDDLKFDGSKLILGQGNATLAEYTAKKYRNTQFNFAMKAEVINPDASNAQDAWVGIYLRQNGIGWCWTGNSAAMLDLKQQLIQYQQFPAPVGWSSSVKEDMIRKDIVLEMGRNYQVSVGVYDTKIDGQILLE